MPFIEPYWNFLLVHPLISLLVGAYDLVHDFGFARPCASPWVRVRPAAGAWTSS